MASCLSALTQKKRLTQEEEELLQAHSLVWGCDTCQLVCPHNHGVENTPLAFFREERIPVLTQEILSYLQESGDFEKRAAL
jgi:epoxyqueuosine reductase